LKIPSLFVIYCVEGCGFLMYQEKDFIIQQIKGIAKTLGKFLGLEQIKEIIDVDEEQLETVPDDELETILAAAKLENIILNSDFTVEEISDQLDIEKIRLDAMLNNKEVANGKEISKMKDFIAENSEYL